MGFFKEIFSGRKDYPQLDASCPAAQRLAEFQDELEQLMDQVHDALEIIPSANRTFVFIGKPPKRFGLAWIEGHDIKNLKSLAEEKGVAPDHMNRIVNDLREAYEHSQGEPRFGTSLAGKPVVVAPSQQLEREVEEIIRNAEH